MFDNVVRGLNWLLNNEEICTPRHLGRFPNPDNNCQFFECAMNYKNLVNCSKTNQIENVVQLKSEIEPNKKGQSTSLAVVYKVNECVSLILHQCSPNHSYSNRLQKCIFDDDVVCPE